MQQLPRPMGQGLLIVEASWSDSDTTVCTTSLDEWSARRRDLYQKIHNKSDRHPCPHRDSNPQSQQASGSRLTRPLGSATCSTWKYNPDVLRRVSKLWNPSQMTGHFKVACQISKWVLFERKFAVLSLHRSVRCSWNVSNPIQLPRQGKILLYMWQVKKIFELFNKR
jgi:hypothetical protein